MMGQYTVVTQSDDRRSLRVSRYHLDTEPHPVAVGNPLWIGSEPLALIASIANLENGEIDLTLDRKLPYTTVGSRVQIGSN